MQPAGKPAVVDFSFRNATNVRFRAYPIKVAELVADCKAYLKTKPNQLDWKHLQVDAGQIGFRLVQQNEKKYLGEMSSEWSLKLEPPTDDVRKHWDSRDRRGNKVGKSRCLSASRRSRRWKHNSHSRIWLNDTTIIKKQLDGKGALSLCRCSHRQSGPQSEPRILRLPAKHTPATTWYQTSECASIQSSHILPNLPTPMGKVILDSTKNAAGTISGSSPRRLMQAVSHYLGFRYVGLQHNV